MKELGYIRSILRNKDMLMRNIKVGDVHPDGSFSDDLRSSKWAIIGQRVVSINEDGLLHYLFCIVNTKLKKKIDIHTVRNEQAIIHGKKYQYFAEILSDLEKVDEEFCKACAECLGG